MQTINSTTGLKEAIRLLEIEQEEKGRLLAEQYRQTRESLKPFNLFSSALKEINLQPSLIDTILSTVLGFATGQISKKIVVGKSANIFRKLFGTIIKISVANIIAQHPKAIKSIGKYIRQYMKHKKEMNSE